jgi:hypothetical protein
MRRHQLVPLLALTLALGALPARVSQAQWQLNGAPVCTAANNQIIPTIVSDGAGGAIVTWYDGRSASLEIYAQRLNAAGVPQWTADGVALCTSGGVQSYNGAPGPAIVSDGAGGAIVTWMDSRSGTSNDIYAQRVNAAGAPQWSADGVALCTAANAQYDPTIASDGAGGAIVTWDDYRSYPSGNSNFDSYADIYAQRVNAAGAPQWTTDGVALCTITGGQYNPTIASDGAGGAIVTWFDYRGGGPGGIDIFAQRVSAEGMAQWTVGGVALCTAAGNRWYPSIVSDDAGGAIVTWPDGRPSSPYYGVYAQRVNDVGVPQWSTDGVALCTGVTSNERVSIASDGAEGAIVTWRDYRSGTSFDIYAQRVSDAGAPQWTADGVALCTAANDQYSPMIASDGAAGAIVTWWDGRGTSYDIYAQRVNAAGALQWTADGVAVCTAGDQQGYPTILADGAGGAIVTWQDSRNGGQSPSDIYAQRVYSSGDVLAVQPPGAAAQFELFPPSPNPSRDGQLTIRFSLPSSERVSAEVVDLAGHRVRTLATKREFSPGPQVLGWNGKNDAGVRLSSGVYFVVVREGTHSEARRAILLH